MNKLSPVENSIYNLCVEEKLTPKQISNLRGCSLSNVYKVIRRIRKKGYMSEFGSEKKVDVGVGDKKVQKSGLTKALSRAVSHFEDSEIRLHNMTWRIDILEKFEQHKDKKIRKYQEKKSVVIEGHTIKMWKDTLEIYSKIDFWGSNASEAFMKSISYWESFWFKLENDLKIKITKPRKQNKFLTRCEFANTNNEIAKKCISEGSKLRVYGEDGVLWALIDNSHNLFEFETVDPARSKPDMKGLEEY